MTTELVTSLPESIQTTVTNYHWLEGLNNIHLFLSWKFKIRIVADLVARKTCFLAYGQLFLLYLRMVETVKKLSEVFFIRVKSSWPTQFLQPHLQISLHCELGCNISFLEGHELSVYSKHGSYWVTSQNPALKVQTKITCH